MAKLIRIGRKLGRVGGRLVSDAGGAPCCCGGDPGGCSEICTSCRCEIKGDLPYAWLAQPRIGVPPELVDEAFGDFNCATCQGSVYTCGNMVTAPFLSSPWGGVSYEFVRDQAVDLCPTTEYPDTFDTVISLADSGYNFGSYGPAWAQAVRGAANSVPLATYGPARCAFFKPCVPGVTVGFPAYPDPDYAGIGPFYGTPWRTDVFVHFRYAVRVTEIQQLSPSPLVFVATKIVVGMIPVLEHVFKFTGTGDPCADPTPMTTGDIRIMSTAGSTSSGFSFDTRGYRQSNWGAFLSPIGLRRTNPTAAWATWAQTDEPSNYDDCGTVTNSAGLMIYDPDMPNGYNWTDFPNPFGSISTVPQGRLQNLWGNTCDDPGPGLLGFV